MDHQQPNFQQSNEKLPEISHQFKLKWLGIGHGIYKEQLYQYVYRPMTRQRNLQSAKKGTDGIQIIPIVEYTEHKQIVFIANFRPAVGKFVIEFPAGLAQGQDMFQNAKRQLEQQTGLIPYKFVEMPCPVIYADPCKGNQSGIYYIALINGQDPSSFVPFKRQPTENIRCYSMKYDKEKGICNQFQKFAKQNDYIFDAKTWVVCLAVDMVQKLKKQEIFVFKY